MQGEETWMELHVLHRHGWSIAALAREFGLNWRTAHRLCATRSAPARCLRLCARLAVCPTGCARLPRLGPSETLTRRT